MSPLSMFTFVSAWLLRSWAALQVRPPEIVAALISPPSMSKLEPSISVAPAVSFPVRVKAAILAAVSVVMPPTLSESSMVTPLFWTILPLVPSHRTIALSVLEPDELMMSPEASAIICLI